MNLALLNILFHALASAPSLISDVENMLKANWSHPLVQDAQQGIGMLKQLVDDISGQQPAPPVALAPGAPSQQPSQG